MTKKESLSQCVARLTPVLLDDALNSACGHHNIEERQAAARAGLDRVLAIREIMLGFLQDRIGRMLRELCREKKIDLQQASEHLVRHNPLAPVAERVFQRHNSKKPKQRRR